MIIIGILSIGVGSFYDYNSKTQRYKAETCMNNLNGELQWFMRAAFTSKQLRVGNTEVFPNYYNIEFRVWEGENKIRFLYSTGAIKSIGTEYKSISLNDYCKQKEVSLLLTGVIPPLWWDSGKMLIIMNKGFRQVEPQEITTFSIDTTVGAFTGSVQFNICVENSCTKELGRWIIDARSQTISPITCRFYSETNSNLCEVRGS